MFVPFMQLTLFDLPPYILQCTFIKSICRDTSTGTKAALPLNHLQCPLYRPLLFFLLLLLLRLNLLLLPNFQSEFAMCITLLYLNMNLTPFARICCVCN